LRAGAWVSAWAFIRFILPVEGRSSRCGAITTQDWHAGFILESCNVIDMVARGHNIREWTGVVG